MQKFNKGIIHRSANKMIAFSSCSQTAEIRFRTRKITVTAHWSHRHRNGSNPVHVTGMGTHPMGQAMSLAGPPAHPR